MRLCSSLPANRSVCARRARGEEVCRSRWTEHPPGGDFHLAISGDFEMAIDTLTGAQTKDEDYQQPDTAAEQPHALPADRIVWQAGYGVGNRHRPVSGGVH